MEYKMNNFIDYKVSTQLKQINKLYIIVTSFGNTLFKDKRQICDRSVNIIISPATNVIRTAIFPIVKANDQPGLHMKIINTK